jgi:hypothetical protein
MPVMLFAVTSAGVLAVLCVLAATDVAVWDRRAIGAAAKTIILVNAREGVLGVLLACLSFSASACSSSEIAAGDAKDRAKVGGRLILRE